MPNMKVVVVTGGTRGLGRSLVELFLARGAWVWMLARGFPAEEARLAGVRYLTADVRDRAALDQAVAAINVHPAN